MVAYGGYTFSTLGTVEMNCDINSAIYRIEFQIVDKSVASLIGLADSLKTNLTKLNESIHEVQTSGEFKDKVMEKHKELFDDNLGKLPVVYSMKVDSNVTPVINPPRKIPIAMEKNVKKM